MLFKNRRNEKLGKNPPHEEIRRVNAVQVRREIVRELPHRREKAFCLTAGLSFRLAEPLQRQRDAVPIHCHAVKHGQGKNATAR